MSDRLKAMGKAVPSEEELCYDMLQAEEATRCVYCQEDFEDEDSLKMAMWARPSPRVPHAAIGPHVQRDKGALPSVSTVQEAPPRE